MALEQMNNGFGPVFSKRKERDTKFLYFITFAIGIAVIITAMTYKDFINFQQPVNDSSIIEFICQLSALTSSLMLGKVLRKLSLFGEECFHINGRYGGSFSKALSACFQSKNKNKHHYIWLALTSTVTIYYWYVSLVPKISTTVYLTIVFFSSFVTRLLGGTYLSNVEISEINENQSGNVAEGLAWSYYFGYLRFYLKDLDYVIEQSVGENHMYDEENMRDLISRHKLIIIISKSCFGYKFFRDVDKRITELGNLSALHKTRGSILNRTYKSTLYKISLENQEPLYLTLEYPPPLLSIYDMQKKKNQEYTNFTEEDMHEQVVRFYLKLKEILERDEKRCQGKYQIILCEDISKNLPEIIYKCVEDPRIEVL